MAKKAKAKKRGVKPGTKRGKYRTAKQIQNRLLKITAISNGLKVGDTVNFDPGPAVGNTSTLCGDLDYAIMLLENRISNSIAKINSLM